MKRRILSVMVCLTLILSFLPQTAFAAPTSGRCGENVTWTLDADGTLTISGTGDMYDYRGVASEIPWYSCRSGIQKVVIEDGVTSIGDYAFSDCAQLNGITIAGSVVHIGELAFFMAKKILSFQITGEGDYSIENGILFNKDKTKLIMYPSGKTSSYYSIPNSVKYINRGAFHCCTYLTEITIPNSVLEIGDCAFSLCDNLEKVVMPNSVLSIGEALFDRCVKLYEVILSENLKSIPWLTFGDCSILKNITIPDGVTEIGGYAFQNCTNLSNVVVPDSVASIGGYAFQGCKNLNDITIPYGVQVIEGHTFRGCGLKNVIIPNSVTNIGVWAFKDCIKLESIRIPESVTYIFGGSGPAFEGCEILTVFSYLDSYAEKYANEYNIKFSALKKFEPITYSCGQTAQIGLIEPWFLKANLRVYDEENPTNIDYDKLIDYGAYFVRKSDLGDAAVTQSTVTAEHIVNNPETVKYTREDGSVFIDGSYLSARYEKGIYTYELSDSVFVMFYIEDEAGIHYAPIRERNLYELAKARSKDTSGDFGELEKSVYSAMVAMYDAITEYRKDYYSKK